MIQRTTRTRRTEEDRILELEAKIAQIRARAERKKVKKLVNTDRGATLWTGSSARWIQLARVNGDSTGSGSFSITDRESQVQKLVYDMVQEASSDFRPTWVRQRAP